ncbi:MAG: hypothetical protein JXR97_09030 [Planctomycetes bacterium]|nr:hypothetical protein [Planctomycetota bacterium]
MSKNVLGVGHCGLDAPRIARVVEGLGAHFSNVDSNEKALQELKKEEYALVMPNRVIGGDEEGGLKLVKAIMADPELAGTNVMVVSGFDYAQKAAVEAGAIMGIGKNILETPAAAEALKPYLL